MGVLPSKVIDASTNAGVLLPARGSFPPIINWASYTGGVNAVAGNAYIHNCSLAGTPTLALPASPNDGDEIGFYNTYAGPSPWDVNTNGNNVRTPGNGNANGAAETMGGDSPTVLRWVASENAWFVVFGNGADWGT